MYKKVKINSCLLHAEARTYRKALHETDTLARIRSEFEINGVACTFYIIILAHKVFSSEMKTIVKPIVVSHIHTQLPNSFHHFSFSCKNMRLFFQFDFIYSLHLENSMKFYKLQIGKICVILLSVSLVSFFVPRLLFKYPETCVQISTYRNNSVFTQCTQWLARLIFGGGANSIGKNKRSYGINIQSLYTFNQSNALHEYTLNALEVCRIKYGNYRIQLRNQ